MRRSGVEYSSCGVDSCSHYFLPFYKLTLLFFFFSLCDTGFNECFNSNWCVLNSCLTSLSMLSFRNSCGGRSIDLSKFNSSGFFHPINPQKLIKLLSLADLFFFGSNAGLDSNLPGEGDYLEITGGEVKNGGPTFQAQIYGCKARRLGASTSCVDEEHVWMSRNTQN